ncbi:hypothetical protein Cni_G00734 [Canna indica]|uniref:SAM domain-containing protein n=1 Tax=Canna indica TaxID=4628 RepID=A0AAQ3JLH9_9LILI|nr:hypothetical protein Cni_G00734 [Canna indica]
MCGSAESYTSLGLHGLASGQKVIVPVPVIIIKTSKSELVSILKFSTVIVFFLYFKLSFVYLGVLTNKDRQIGRNDLRFKLINKSFFRKGQNGREGQNGVDLREKLSRNREIYLKSDRKQNLRDSRTSGSARRLPPTRSADDLLQLDMLRKPYPSRVMDERRHRSPDRLFSSSRVLSSRRSYEDLPHGPSMRSIEASGHSSFIKNGLVDSSRTIPFMSKTRLPIDTGKSVVRDPQSGRITQRSTLTPEEPLTVSSLLKTLGLGKYAIMFQAEEIDMTALRQMGDRDLKELGIPMGPRKKILLAALSQSKQRY